MPINHQFPYANTHDQNYDWILKEIKDFSDKYHSIDEEVEQALAAIEAAKNQGIIEMDAALTNGLNSINAYLQNAEAAIASDRNNAIRDINDNKNEALLEMETQETETIEAITSNKNEALTSIESSKNSAITDIDSESLTALQNLQTSLTQALSDIHDAETNMLGRVTELIETLPSDSQEILGLLNIILSILNTNFVYTAIWKQGYFTGDSGITFIINNTYLSTDEVHASGIAGRRCKIDCESGYIIYEVSWWYTENDTEYRETINLDDNQHFDFTFSSLAEFMSITIRKSDSSVITAADVQGNVSIQWPMNAVNVPNMIAYVESTSTASIDHIVGETSEFFMYNGALYHALEDISQYSTIYTSGPNKNAESIIVMDEVGGIPHDISELTDRVEALESNVETIDDVIIITPSVNMYNQSDNTLETILNASGQEVSNGSYQTTDFMDVRDAETINVYFANATTLALGVCTYARHVCFYNESKEYIANSHDDERTGSYTVPANAKYIRFSLHNNNIIAPLLVCNADDVPEKYVPYGDTTTLKDSPYLTLNSIASLPFMEGSALDSHDDLNELEDGVYYARGQDIVATLQNCPVNTSGFKIITVTMYGSYKYQYLFDVSGGLWYRVKTSSYTVWHKASDFLPKITLDGTIKWATYGNDLAPDLSTFTGSNADYSGGKWLISENGYITCPVTVEENKQYRVTIDMTPYQVDSQMGEIARHFYVDFNDETISLYVAGDYHPDVVISATEDETATLKISTDRFSSIYINAVRIVPVVTYPTFIMQANSLKFFGYGQSLCFGNGQSNLLYGAVSNNDDFPDIECGKRNTGLGNGAQGSINTGCWNTAVGYNAQNKLINGKGNCAFGTWTQSQLRSGMYNNAFGESAQGKVTDGNWNDAFGIETQGDLTSGCNNVSMGRRSHHKLNTGNRNVAIGAWSGFNASDMPNEGAWASVSDNNQVLIGASATKCNAENADDLVAVGYRARGSKNSVAIGSNSKANGENSIAIGKGAETSNNNEMVLGNSNITSVIIAGKKITFNSDGSVTWENVI